MINNIELKKQNLIKIVEDFFDNNLLEINHINKHSK